MTVVTTPQETTDIANSLATLRRLATARAALLERPHSAFYHGYSSTVNNKTKAEQELEETEVAFGQELLRLGGRIKQEAIVIAEAARYSEEDASE